MNKPQIPIAPFAILAAADQLGPQLDKAAVLKKYNSFVLRTLLQANYHKGIVFDLPEGEPPFRRMKPAVRYDYVPLTLIKAVRQLPLFITRKRIPRYRKEKLFIQLLEALPVPEAEMLVAIKDKALQKVFVNLTPATAFKAFPEIFGNDEKNLIEFSRYRGKPIYDLNGYEYYNTDPKKFLKIDDIKIVRNRALKDPAEKKSGRKTLPKTRVKKKNVDKTEKIDDNS